MKRSWEFLNILVKLRMVWRMPLLGGLRYQNVLRRRRKGSQIQRSKFKFDISYVFLIRLEEIDATRKQKADPLLQMRRVEEEFERIRKVKKLEKEKERAAVAQVMSSCASLFPDDIKTPAVSYVLFMFRLDIIYLSQVLVQQRAAFEQFFTAMHSSVASYFLQICCAWAVCAHCFIPTDDSCE